MRGRIPQPGKGNGTGHLPKEEVSGGTSPQGIADSNCGESSCSLVIEGSCFDVALSGPEVSIILSSQPPACQPGVDTLGRAYTFLAEEQRQGWRAMDVLKGGVWIDCEGVLQLRQASGGERRE